MIIARTRFKELRKALWSPQGIGFFKKLRDRRRAQFWATTNIAMVTGNQQRQVPALSWCPKACTHFVYKIYTAGLVPRMAWQIVGRRQSLAKVVQENGKAYGQGVAVHG